MKHPARALVAGALAATLAAGPAFAQEQPEPVAVPEPAGPPAAQASDEPDLSVSLDRIRRGLAAQPRNRETRHGLRLDYYVEVYGKAPELKLFAPDTNLTSAPVMYGGMTHREFLQVVTPEEFRAPPADIPSAIAALIKWVAEKKKNDSPKR